MNVIFLIFDFPVEKNASLAFLLQMLMNMALIATNQKKVLVWFVGNNQPFCFDIISRTVRKSCRLFVVTFSLNPLKFLLSHVSFGHATTKSSQSKNNRFATFCEMFEEFNRPCGNHVITLNCFSFDEPYYIHCAQK